MQFAYRQRPPSIGRAALRWGLIFGLLHGIISSILTALAATIFIRFSGVLTLLSIPIACIFFFLAGFFAARQTRRVVSGTLGGLWAGFISRILSTILVVIFNLFYQLPRHPQPGGQTVSVSRLAPLFVLELLYLVLDLGLGAGFGALSGLLGKSVSKVPPPLPTYTTPPAPRPQPSAPISAPQPSAPISEPRPPASMMPADPAPYGTPFFPPPYPVPPTQSQRPQ